MLDYIKGNIDFTENYLREHIPGIGMIRPQASYLIYLDCRGLGLTQGGTGGTICGQGTSGAE